MAEGGAVGGPTHEEGTTSLRTLSDAQSTVVQPVQYPEYYYRGSQIPFLCGPLIQPLQNPEYYPPGGQIPIMCDPLMQPLQNPEPLGGQIPFLSGPLKQPATTAHIMDRLGRSIKLSCSVFMDRYAPAHKQNPDYIAVVAQLIGDHVTDEMQKSVHIVAQACATGYSPQDCETPEVAKNLVISGIRKYWPIFPDSVTCRAVPNAAWPADNAQVPTDEELAAILFEIATDPAQKADTVTIFTSGLIAMCKQGNVTANMVTKVYNVIREDVGLDIVLQPDVIRAVWFMIGNWYVPSSSTALFRLWEKAVGATCMRLRFLVTQAKWAGMTNYANILKATAMFPNFPWDQLTLVIPQDFEAFQAAKEAVNDNPYYGYRRDLGPAKSTNYQGLCYAAWLLLSETGGDRNLKNYKGVNKCTPKAPQIDDLVKEYGRTLRTNL